MARHPTTMNPGYFEEMFRGTSDPWNLESSPYEQAKFDESISALEGRTYDNGFEVGCAKGVLTSRLAPLCATLLSIDVSETALAAARQRTAHLGQVGFARMAFPAEAPAASFDVVVWSEVAYYWDDADLERAAVWLRSHLVPGGDLLLVHFTGDTDYPQSGDDAVAKLRATLEPVMTVIKADRHDRYRLDLWRRTS
ncbi:MAG: SAM-dependent methyltransferase [Sphingobium sp.]